jgi:hypothetical protein
MKVRKLSIVFVLSVLMLSVTSASAQQQFGVDAENLDVTVCNPSVGCPLIDQAQAAGAHWMRLLTIWRFLEPSENNFDWGLLPWQVWYAQQHGINIYFTGVWAPQWANGAVSTCPPYTKAHQYDPNGVMGPDCQFGYRDVGRTVTNSNYTYTFFYNLALQFNGSDVSGCPASNVSTCHPLVQYYGVWNEPNGLNNFNDTYFNPNNLGNYLNDFASQYLIPAHNGVKQANPSAFVVAPDIGTGSSACGGFGCGSWDNSWMAPLAWYYSSYFDIISIHGYNGHATDRDNVDRVYNNWAYGRPIWETETAASGGTNDLTLIYVDEYNRMNYWPRVFYSMGGYGSSCGGNTLLCSNDGVTLQQTPYFYAYQSVYGPH